jgi:uncharacterized protein (TIGR03067 family)
MRTRIFLGMAIAVMANYPMIAFAQAPVPPGAGPQSADTTPKAFVGVWVPISCEVKGAEQFSEQDKRDFRLSIEKGEHKLYQMTNHEKGEGIRVFANKLTVDEKAGTFELEMLSNKLQAQQLKLHGIFEFQGTKMKLCYGPADKPRPTKFAAPKETSYFNEVWEQQSKK